LNDIRNGTITVIDINGEEIENSAISESSFYPDNTAPDPSFAVGETWA
jgi:hypothetical protein